MSESIKELMRSWNQFCNWVIESNPNYTDNDFTFNNFMEWLNGDDSEQLPPNT